MNNVVINPETKKKLYRYLISNGYSRLTIKILLGVNPDGGDRLTIALGKGSSYDYRLLTSPEFHKSELKRLLKEI